MGQLANALSRRDEGKLPSQSVANPKGQYEVHDIQAKAIMTLRAGHEIDTRPEEEKKDKKEEEKSSNNSKVVVSESPSPKGDVSLPPTCAKELPTAPRVLRAPFPACLTSPSSFDKKASQYPPIEEADCCAITMMDELVEEALPYILTEDPLEACLTHFGFDEYDIDHSIEDVNALLGETTPFIDRHPWYAKFELLPPLAESPALPSIESPPQLELKPLPATLKYSYLGPNETLPVIIASDLTAQQEGQLIDVLCEHKNAIGWYLLLQVWGHSALSFLFCTYLFFRMEAPFFMPEDDLFPLRLHHALIWAFNLDEYMFNPIFQDGYWIPPEEHILNIFE
ncbi:hypothetical protein Acr_26g0000220 [Actinidia rufa]|uniref:Uncharacterized protein n=1 Tax=Actinidia rufa TaxID=165716 RepID=A0A7J0H130_9ERIC|nr:hypothetical protein Acr_26g0000220 [Actinidia rufa]